MTEPTPQEPVTITLAGKTSRLHAVFEDLSAIEQKLSTSIVALAKKFSHGLATLEDMVVILEHSVEAEFRAIDMKAAVLTSGIAHVTERISAFFVQLFKGSHAPAKSPEPEHHSAPHPAPAPAPNSAGN